MDEISTSTDIKDDYLKIFLNSIIHAVKLSNSIPQNDDFDYHISMDQNFRKLISSSNNQTALMLIKLCEISNLKYLQNTGSNSSNGLMIKSNLNKLSCPSSLLAYKNSLTDSKANGNLKVSSDMLDEKLYEHVTDIIDTLLENADRFIHKHNNDRNSISRPINKASSATISLNSKYKDINNARTSLTLDSNNLLYEDKVDLKPQLTFSEHMDNSKICFKPNLKTKHHAKLPLNESLKYIPYTSSTMPMNFTQNLGFSFGDIHDDNHNDVSRFGFSHPYEYELTQLQYQPWQLESLVTNSGSSVFHTNIPSTDLRNSYDSNTNINPQSNISFSALFKKENISLQSTACNNLTGFINVDLPNANNRYFQYVDTDKSLLEMINYISGGNSVSQKAHEIALDIENHSLRSYQGLVCLIQLSTRERDYIIDTTIDAIRNGIREHFGKILADPEIVKVIHGSRNDILWLQRDFSLYIVNLFDTHEAAKFLKIPLSCSYANLVKYYCGGLTLDKKHQLSDWRQRPLPEDMLTYARFDTMYLLYVYDKICLELWNAYDKTSAGLQSVLNISKKLCLKRYEKPICRSDGYLDYINKLKTRSGLGSLNLDLTQLNASHHDLLSSLYVWRDDMARTYDESCDFILSPSEHLSIGVIAPKTENELAKIININKKKLICENFTDQILGIINGSIIINKSKDDLMSQIYPVALEAPGFMRHLGVARQEIDVRHQQHSAFGPISSSATTSHSQTSSFTRYTGTEVDNSSLLLHNSASATSTYNSLQQPIMSTPFSSGSAAGSSVINLSSPSTSIHNSLSTTLLAPSPVLPPDEIYRLAGWNTPLPFQPITSGVGNTHDTSSTRNNGNNSQSEKMNYIKLSHSDKMTSSESILASSQLTDYHTSFVSKIPHASSGNPIVPTPVYPSERLQKATSVSDILQTIHSASSSLDSSVSIQSLSRGDKNISETNTSVPVSIPSTIEEIYELSNRNRNRASTASASSVLSTASVAGVNASNVASNKNIRKAGEAPNAVTDNIGKAINRKSTDLNNLNTKSQYPSHESRINDLRNLVGTTENLPDDDNDIPYFNIPTTSASPQRSGSNPQSAANTHDSSENLQVIHNTLELSTALGWTSSDESLILMNDWRRHVTSTSVGSGIAVGGSDSVPMSPSTSHHHPTHSHQSLNMHHSNFNLHRSPQAQKSRNSNVGDAHNSNFNSLQTSPVIGSSHQRSMSEHRQQKSNNPASGYTNANNNAETANYTSKKWKLQSSPQRYLSAQPQYPPPPQSPQTPQHYLHTGQSSSHLQQQASGPAGGNTFFHSSGSANQSLPPHSPSQSLVNRSVYSKSNNMNMTDETYRRNVRGNNSHSSSVNSSYNSNPFSRVINNQQNNQPSHNSNYNHG